MLKIAHRGYTKCHEDNTLCAFNDAIYHNFDMIEIDIQLDKTEQSSDWSKKKLSKKQIEYAMNDVLYLSEIKDSLNEKLINQRRLKLFFC